MSTIAAAAEQASKAAVAVSKALDGELMVVLNAAQSVSLRCSSSSMRSLPHLGNVRLRIPPCRSASEVRTHHFGFFRWTMANGLPNDCCKRRSDTRGIPARVYLAQL